MILTLAPIVYVFYIKDFGVGKAAIRYTESFTETVKGEHIQYHLRAIVVHEGPDRKSGHFRAFAKSAAKVWHMVDSNYLA